MKERERGEKKKEFSYGDKTKGTSLEKKRREERKNVLIKNQFPFYTSLLYLGKIKKHIKREKIFFR